MDSKAQAVAFKNQGNEYFKARDFDKAVEFYTKAIELDDGQHTFYSNRSAAAFGAGNIALAASDGEKCVTIDPTFLKG